MFYLINKPSGITSSYALRQFLKEHNISKGGHSGTLDPFATGLLIIGTNEDTKFLSRFLDAKKTYEGKILFGKRTDTLDPDGKIINEDSEVSVSLETLRNEINTKFLGQIKQVPPEYSAKKINGKRAYELVRENKIVILKPVKKIIYQFDIFETETRNVFDFKIVASSGTYIRSLARDLGDELEIPSMLITLNRTKISNIDLKDAKNLTDPLDEFKVYSPKDLFGVNSLELSDSLLKLILEGKRTNIGNDKSIDEELIVHNALNSISVLVKNVGKNTYHIVKRLK